MWGLVTLRTIWVSHIHIFWAVHIPGLEHFNSSSDSASTVLYYINQSPLILKAGEILRVWFQRWKRLILRVEEVSATRKGRAIISEGLCNHRVDGVLIAHAGVSIFHGRTRCQATCWTPITTTAWILWEQCEVWRRLSELDHPKVYNCSHLDLNAFKLSASLWNWFPTISKYFVTFVYL